MAITADTAPLFPATPSYGFIASPTYRTRIPETEGGYERPNRLWSRPLLYITAAPFDDASVLDLDLVRDFFHVMAGAATYFRFKDWSDYKSCGSLATVTPLDQPLVLLTGNNYQLVRNYTITLPGGGGTLTQVREIYKPVGSTFRCANGSGVEQDGTKWTLDEANGVLIKGGTFTGTPTAWGGEYDVETRFAEDMLNVEVPNFGTRTTRFALREARREPTT